MSNFHFVAKRAEIQGGKESSQGQKASAWQLQVEPGPPASCPQLSPPAWPLWTWLGRWPAGPGSEAPPPAATPMHSKCTHHSSYRRRPYASGCEKAQTRTGAVARDGSWKGLRRQREHRWLGSGLWLFSRLAVGSRGCAGRSMAQGGGRLSLARPQPGPSLGLWSWNNGLGVVAGAAACSWWPSPRHHRETARPSGSPPRCHPQWLGGETCRISR